MRPPNSFSKNLLKIVISAALLAALIFWSEPEPAISKFRWFELPMRIFISPFSGLLPSEEEGKALRGRLGLAYEEDDPAVLSFKIKLLEEENAALRKALKIKEKSGLPLLEAYVSARFREFGGEYLLLNGGEESGIRVGDLAVTEKDILVGRVVEVGNSFSKVSLASNRGEVFEVSVLAAGIRGVARGVGGRAFLLDFLPQDYILSRGDFVSISAAARSGESSFLLGIINKTKAKPGSPFQEAEVVLLAYPEFLRRVFVVSKL